MPTSKYNENFKTLTMLDPSKFQNQKKNSNLQFCSEPNFEAQPTDSTLSTPFPMLEVNRVFFRVRFGCQNLGVEKRGERESCNTN